ncbi:GNAT family N-acetyltransferase [Nocardia nepalensis]|uniref:GNAT family N-acetyltransferase n=1 Tax=Nocardia nepalensis TaxID=3375448 RepID=UPI003B673655
MTSSATAQAVVLRSEQYDSPNATAMIAKALAVNEELYGHPDQTPVAPEEFTPQEGGTFVVAYLNGAPIGCGGYRRHVEDENGTTAEIKRMYVEPHVRRRGVAQQLLARLEDDARSAGYRAAILDTGSKQAASHALYEKCGYERTAGFSIYRDKPGNRAYWKALLPRA